MNPVQQNLSIADYSYHLPSDRIAAFPLPSRDGSRLLLYRQGEIDDRSFSDLPQLLPPGTVLILNNTRVIEARLLFEKPTGGVIQVFCLEPSESSVAKAMGQTGSAVWSCMIGGASKWKAGQVLEKRVKVKAEVEGEVQAVDVLFKATYLEKQEDSFLIRFDWEPASLSFVEVLHAAGAIPLPPYIKREAGEGDAERYQTVFGHYDGSVAAPTAALHFTRDVFQKLQEQSIRPLFLTLHVGAGTFKPVKSETMGGHHMHSEPFTVEKAVLENMVEAEKIVAVGTTSLRTLESLHWIGLKLRENGEAAPELEQWEAYELEEKYRTATYRESYSALLKWMDAKGLHTLDCRTRLLIAPGYSFKVPAGLVTNFHQPQSTLILLVAAFIGEDWRKVYEHALDKGYRFLSYGDSSLLWRNQ